MHKVILNLLNYIYEKSNIKIFSIPIQILQNDKLINAGVVIDNDTIALGGEAVDRKEKKNCLSC